MGYDVGSTFYNRAETVLTKANAATLDIAWQKDLGGPVYSAPLQIGDKIYVAAPSTVRAYVAATGEELWSMMASSTSSLSYADGTLYLNDRSSQHRRDQRRRRHQALEQADQHRIAGRWIVVRASRRRHAGRRRFERRDRADRRHASAAS